MTDCTCDLCQFDAACESCRKPLCRDSISRSPVVDVRGRLSCAECANQLEDAAGGPSPKLKGDSK